MRWSSPRPLLASIAIGLLLANSCGSLDSRRYYAPSGASGKTAWEDQRERERLSRWGGPDNRIRLTESGVTLEVWSPSFDTPTMWLLGPRIPLVPVFPIWWLLWWTIDDLDDHDMELSFVLDAPVELTYEPERWEIVTDKGERFRPSAFSSWYGWDHPEGDAGAPRSLKPGARESLTYPTRGKPLKQFTLRLTFPSPEGDIVFPAITFKRSTGTVVSYVPWD